MKKACRIIGAVALIFLLLCIAFVIISLLKKNKLFLKDNNMNNEIELTCNTYRQREIIELLGSPDSIMHIDGDPAKIIYRYGKDEFVFSPSYGLPINEDEYALCQINLSERRFSVRGITVCKARMNVSAAFLFNERIPQDNGEKDEYLIGPAYDSIRMTFGYDKNGNVTQIVVDSPNS